MATQRRKPNDFLGKNQANTAGNAYYTPNAKGEVHSRNGRAPHGHRYVSVENTSKSRIGDQRYIDSNDKSKGKEIAKYESGGTEGTHMRVVSRRQQYQAIRSAFGLTAG